MGRSLAHISCSPPPTCQAPSTKAASSPESCIQQLLGKHPGRPTCFPPIKTTGAAPVRPSSLDRPSSRPHLSGHPAGLGTARSPGSLPSGSFQEALGPPSPSCPGLPVPSSVPNSIMRVTQQCERHKAKPQPQAHSGRTSLPEPPTLGFLGPGWGHAGCPWTSLASWDPLCLKLQGRRGANGGVIHRTPLSSGSDSSGHTSNADMSWEGLAI
jgi:hypothetical protein